MSSPRLISPRSSGSFPIPIGVLGDSDSHSYQDRIHFPNGGKARGGPYRTSTFQWTETLARLRGTELDLGPWDTWGVRRSRAALMNLFGRPERAPRKQDYRHNFAISGARCDDLMLGVSRQAPRLLDVMNEDSEYWRRGVVVIRMGTNDFGGVARLDRIARNPDASDVKALIDNGLQRIRSAVDLIQRTHPETRFLLVGIFDNSNWAKYLSKWHSLEALNNISSGLDRFDHGLQAVAASNPRVAFFDERAWFRKRWGTRGSDGKPAYGVVDLGGGWKVSNTGGDAPLNTVVHDGHGGLVWNALWAQALVETLNDRFALGVRPIDPAELLDFLNSTSGSAIVPRVLNSVRTTGGSEAAPAGTLR